MVGQRDGGTLGGGTVGCCGMGLRWSDGGGQFDKFPTFNMLPHNRHVSLHPLHVFPTT